MSQIITKTSGAVKAASAITLDNFFQDEVIQQQSNNSILRSELPICYPFVKWAGGKTQLLEKLYSFIPSKFNLYFEPFLGGGALFFYLTSNKNRRFMAFLSDINPKLINTYLAVKDNVQKLIILLTQHELECNK